MPFGWGIVKSSILKIFSAITYLHIRYEDVRLISLGFDEVVSVDVVRIGAKRTSRFAFFEELSIK